MPRSTPSVNLRSYCVSAAASRVEAAAFAVFQLAPRAAGQQDRHGAHSQRLFHRARGESPEKPGISHDELTEAQLHARDSKDPDALLQAAWSIEAARVLAWIVGFVDLDPTRQDLADPQELYDVPEAKPPSLQEMCEARERTFSLRWYGVDMGVRRSQGAPIPDTAPEPTGQEESILLERHHACTWFMESLPPSYDRVDRST